MVGGNARLVWEQPPRLSTERSEELALLPHPQFPQPLRRRVQRLRLLAKGRAHLPRPILRIAFVIFSGGPAKPTRHPVTLHVFDIPLIGTARSRMPSSDARQISRVTSYKMRS